MIRTFAALTVLLPAFSAFAQPVEIPTGRNERPQLKSIYSETHELAELIEPSTQFTVFLFLDNDCPVALQYIPTIKALHEKYHKRGVQFIGVFPNARIHVLKMAHYAHDQDIPFPLFLDLEHRLADVLEAEYTPEVVIVDKQWVKLYQGAIDNQFKKRGRLRQVSANYLDDALAAALDGRKVEVTFMTPSGCPIERLDPPQPKKGLTYYRDIAPIIQNNCQTCHREGGVAPFELVTYDDSYYSAERIVEAVTERRMPPWHGFPDPKYGELQDDKRLSEKEIDTLVDWVRSGAAEGEAADAPEPIKWPPAGTWEIGKPDFVYEIPGFEVPKNGVLDYQFFRVPLNFKKDRWFSAVEVKPGDMEVVHHVGLHVVPSGDKDFTGFSGMAELYGLTSEGAILINDYVPGDLYNSKRYPPEQAVRIPKGRDLIFELHYTPNNREAVFDQSKVGFQWAEKPPAEEVFTQVFRRPVGRFRIPPHAFHYKMQDSYYFEHDVIIDAIRPHFHLRAKSFRVEIVKRDEDTDEIIHRETVLSVPIWDPDWQRTYEFKKPFKVQAGTEFLATGVFDNTHLNPNNPDPTQAVEWGQQTFDEMFSVRFKYRVIKKDEQ